MANWAVGIAFTEANAARAIKNLCAWAELPAKAPYVGDAESEANAKAALKQVAARIIRQQEAQAAREAAEAQAPPA
jgi:hypothetical protein